MKIFLSLFLISSLLSFYSCTSDKQLKEQIKKVITDDPSILISAIKARPVEFIEALQEAARMAQMEMGKKKDEESKQELENFFQNPLTPKIGEDASIRGNTTAPLVLVEYSDFECPYCARGAKTVEELRNKYGSKIQFVFKHLPLAFHSKALISAKYFEAIRMQDPEKAWRFHDQLFNSNKELLEKGEAHLKALAKKVGANMDKLSKDINLEKIAKRIEEDKQEAGQFGFQGTPGFILNGIPVRGAYPTDYFEGIIDELKKRGKVQL